MDDSNSADNITPRLCIESIGKKIICREVKNHAPCN